MVKINFSRLVKIAVMTPLIIAAFTALSLVIMMFGSDLFGFFIFLFFYLTIFTIASYAFFFRKSLLRQGWLRGIILTIGILAALGIVYIIYAIISNFLGEGKVNIGGFLYMLFFIIAPTAFFSGIAGEFFTRRSQYKNLFLKTLFLILGTLTVIAAVSVLIFPFWSEIITYFEK